MVAGTLGTLGRSGDEADFDVVLPHQSRHFFGAVHLEAMDHFAYLEGITVEDADDVEVSGLELNVIEKSLAKIANTDESHFPFAVHIQR